MAGFRPASQGRGRQDDVLVVEITVDVAAGGPGDGIFRLYFHKFFWIPLAFISYWQLAQYGMLDAKKGWDLTIWDLKLLKINLRRSWLLAAC